jgi:hypothetical protein
VLRRTLAALGCAALLAGFALAQAPTRASAASCPDPGFDLQASRLWGAAGTKGGGVTIGVVGAPDRVVEAACAISALAPDATVAPGSANGAIVVVADTSVDPASIGGQALVVAAAGDTGGPMTQRPQGVVNVASAQLTKTAQPSSAWGEQMTLAAFGNDTSTAAGYVAALAAILRADHSDWPARQVVAQMAGSIYGASGARHDDRLGYGVIQPVQAVSMNPPVDPESLPGFDASFPVNQPPRSVSPSTRSAPTSAASGASGAPSSTSSTAATGSSSATQTPQTSAPGTTDSANAWPTNPVLSTGPSNGSHAAAGSGGGGSGFSPILLIGFVLILAGGGYVLWQRRRQPKPAAGKPESEWEAPSGPRHSGYSPPEE